MDKKKLVKEIIAELKAKCETLRQAAIASREVATHEESKPENEYDTRGVEASYLAGAQSRRVVELEKSIALYEALKIRTFGPEDHIDLGALVELDASGEKAFYFVGPEGGGMKLQQEGKTVVVITPQSPLGQSLMDKEADDDLDVGSGAALRSYTIISVS